MPEENTLGQKISAAGDVVSGKSKEESNAASAQYNRNVAEDPNASIGDRLSAGLTAAKDKVSETLGWAQKEQGKQEFKS